jgi:hypothetical protein
VQIVLPPKIATLNHFFFFYLFIFFSSSPSYLFALQIV